MNFYAFLPYLVLTFLISGNLFLDMPKSIIELPKVLFNLFLLFQLTSLHILLTWIYSIFHFSSEQVAFFLLDMLRIICNSKLTGSILITLPGIQMTLLEFNYRFLYPYRKHIMYLNIFNVAIRYNTLKYYGVPLFIYIFIWSQIQVHYDFYRSSERIKFALFGLFGAIFSLYIRLFTLEDIVNHGFIYILNPVLHISFFVFYCRINVDTIKEARDSIININRVNVRKDKKRKNLLFIFIDSSKEQKFTIYCKIVFLLVINTLLLMTSEYFLASPYRFLTYMSLYGFSHLFGLFLYIEEGSGSIDDVIRNNCSLFASLIISYYFFDNFFRI